MPNRFFVDDRTVHACVASSEVRFAFVAGFSNQLPCQATTTFRSGSLSLPPTTSTETTLWFSSKKMLMTPGASVPSEYLPPAYHALKSAMPGSVFSGKIICTSSVSSAASSSVGAWVASARYHAATNCSITFWSMLMSCPCRLSELLAAGVADAVGMGIALENQVDQKRPRARQRLADSWPDLPGFLDAYSRNTQRLRQFRELEWRE